MYTLEKLSDPTKKVHSYNTVTGAYTETFKGGDPISFETEDGALAIKQLINDNNDPSNHVSVLINPKPTTTEAIKDEPTTKKKSKKESGGTWYVAKIENENELFSGWSSTGEPNFTTSLTQAIGFATETEAQETSDQVSEFVGTTPIRK